MRHVVLARGRAAAEAGMVDTCIIRRLLGETTDEFSGEVVKNWDVLYTGKCRFQQPGDAVRATPDDVGQAYLLIQNSEVQLPISAEGIQIGDELTITAAARDPDLVGRVFLVRSLSYKTDASSRRLQVHQRTA